MKTDFLIKYEKQYDMFKDHRENFELVNIFEMYIPFWKCMQKVVAEKSVAIDRFSKVILETVIIGINSHEEICAFLGIVEDAFVTVQFHYLVKNGLIKEVYTDDIKLLYEITPKGYSFLEKKHTVKQLEIVEFHFLYNDLLQTFFDDKITIDSIDNKQQKPIHYKLLANRHLKEGVKVQYKHRPKKLPSLEFATYFNRKMNGYQFYDLDDSNVRTYERSISFLAFEYISKDNSKHYDIRRHKKSIQKFKLYTLEEELSLAVTDYFNKYQTDRS
ncbi:hypothetical protein IMCC3317_17570 [Kordia antarctica]|uniref:Uncharacterized protein n=1 Tax=Kordia antarctica TaxID=1218801 RepID=A0A7L4ZKE5_9FLAO|nr:hypothetical protein [Kordia antarctica]QHI36394.1 hypothetical protein IMCC3317_17570 [Kordia antarctica]